MGTIIASIVYGSELGVMTAESHAAVQSSRTRRIGLLATEEFDRWRGHEPHLPDYLLR